MCVFLSLTPVTPFSQVANLLKDLDVEPERRAHRLIGGVLAETTVGEVTPHLQQQITLIGKTVEAVDAKRTALKKEEYELASKMPSISPEEAAARAEAAAKAARASS